MKRFFICVAAAIVALASCSKTQVVYNDAPEEIGFKVVNMPMTKVSVDYTADLGVSAYYISNNSPYFENALFSLGGSTWTGDHYWPLTAALGFVAYGPGTDCATSVTTATTGISATGVKSDVDFVYSKEYANNGGAGYTKSTVEVPIALAHAKSKINVEVTNGDNETVTKVELIGAYTVGDFSIVYPSTTSWTNTSTGDYDFTTVKTHYVIPGDPVTLRITYNTSSPVATGLTHDITLATVVDGSSNVIDTWNAGTSYTYNVSFASKKIVITADVDDWDPVTGSPTI